MRLSHNDYAIAWVCALPLEMAAAKSMLEETHESLPQPPGDSNSYKLGKLSGHNVVIACLPAGVYGTTSAATVISQMLLTFPALKFGLMVGIGGGVPSKTADIRLGDVVVSTPTAVSSGVIQYDYGKTLSNGRFQRTSSLNKPPRILLNAISNLRSDDMAGNTDINMTISNMLNANERLRQQFSRPKRDWLFSADYNHPDTHSDCSACDQSRLLYRLSRDSHEPRIHYGLIASGNQVVKDAKKRDSIARDLDILCFEMEAAGLMDQLPCLVVRGICDYCDSHKNKMWQGYAALAAAAYSQLLLTVVPPQAQVGVKNVQWDERLRVRQISVLKKLYVCRYQDQKDRNPDRIPGTCEWFVSHPIFQDWQKSPTSQMLWVSANPECGKSVLAKYLADSVLTKGISRTTGYFFFKDDFEDQKIITNALCCILHQIFNQNRSLLTETIIERFEMSEMIANSFSELWDILISIAKEKNAGEIVCLLDALDECEQRGWSQFTEALRRLYKDESRGYFNLKFLITSRPYGRIRKGFRPLDIPGQPIIHLSGESDIEMAKIFQEIDIFIEARVRDIKSRLHLTNDEQNLLLRRLTRVPNRTYLWVYLTLNLIEDKEDIDKRGIVQVTSNLPQSVDDAYEQILSKSTDPQKAKKLLHIVVGASRPLSLQEMNFALALEKNHKSYDDVCLAIEPEDRFHELMSGICGLFVTIVNSRIYLLHQTAREFLVQDTSERLHGVKRGFQWKHSLMLQESHSITATISMQYLLFADFGNDRELAEDAGSFTSKYVFLDYSARYWTVHFLESDLQTDGSMIQSLLLICDANASCFKTWFRIYWASLTTELPTGFTSLIVASYFGLISIATRLVKMDGVDLTARDHVHGRSALSWAAGNGHSTIVRLLTKWSWRRFLKKRVIVDSTDNHNRTPLSWAILNGHEQVASLLLKAGAAIDTKDDIGGMPLYYAICSEHRGLTNLLMKQGTQIQSKEAIQQELLFSAVKKGHEPVVRMLLNQGVDVESRDSEYGRTLLSWAAKNGHVAVVKLLLEKDADLGSRDTQDNRTPLSWAADNGHETVIEILLEKSGLESKVHTEKFRVIVGGIILCSPPFSGDLFTRILEISEQDIIDQLQSLFTLLNMPTDFDFLRSHLQYFFLNTKTTLRVNKFEMHKKIAIRCLHIMNCFLKQNICNLYSFGVRRKHISDRTINECFPEDLRYSCCQWAYHFDQSYRRFNDEVFGFLEKHFLHWLEAMSVMGLVFDTIDIINAFLPVTYKADFKLIEFLYDARRFILRNIHIVDSAPLQVYYSSIAFAPSESIVRKTFRKELGMMSALPETEPSWGAHLQTLQSHQDWVDTLVFSPCSQMIASVSNDNTVWLWNAKTVKELHRFRCDRSHIPTIPHNVVFTPDSQMLASGSNGFTVQCWDIKTGKNVHLTEEYSEYIIYLLSSPKNQKIISGFNDIPIRLREEERDKRVAYSHNGDIAIPGSEDRTIEIWNISTRRRLHTLRVNLDRVDIIVLSPSGYMATSGSKDHTIEIWNINTGKRLCTLRGHPDWVSTIAFSPDGHMVASGSSDWTIRLWYIGAGEELFYSLIRTIHIGMKTE